MFLTHKDDIFSNVFQAHKVDEGGGLETAEAAGQGQRDALVSLLLWSVLIFLFLVLLKLDFSFFKSPPTY